MLATKAHQIFPQNELYILSNMVMDPVTRSYAFLLEPEMLSSEHSRRVLRFIRENLKLTDIEMLSQLVQHEMVTSDFMDFYNEHQSGLMGVEMAIINLKEYLAKQQAEKDIKKLQTEYFTDPYARPAAIAMELSKIAIRLQNTKAGNYSSMDDSVEGLKKTVQEMQSQHDATIKLPFVESVTDLYGGELIAIAGRPGMGKTAVMLNMARRLAAHGTKVGFLSLEMKTPSLLVRLAQKDFPYSLKSSLKHLSDGEHEKFERTLDDLKQLPIFFKDRLEMDFGDVLATIQMMARADQVRVIFIDYLQLLPTKSKAGRSRNDEVAELSRQLKMVALDLNIVVIIGSQLNRQVEQRSEKIPNLADLRDSGAIEQDCDIVLFLFRPEYYNPNDEPGKLKVIVAKQRDGVTGAEWLSYNTDRQVVA